MTEERRGMSEEQESVKQLSFFFLFIKTFIFIFSLLFNFLLIKEKTEEHREISEEQE